MKNNPSGMTSGYTAIAAPTGGISLLATVPTALFLLCQSGIARADEYFDPAALEFANPQQRPLTYAILQNQAASSRGLIQSAFG